MTRVVAASGRARLAPISSFPSAHPCSPAKQTWQILTELLCLPNEHVALKGRRWADPTKATPDRPPPEDPTSHAQGSSWSPTLHLYSSVLLRFISLPPPWSIALSPGIPLPFSFLFFFHSALPSPPSWLLPPFLACLPSASSRSLSRARSSLTPGMRA